MHHDVAKLAPKRYPFRAPPPSRATSSGLPRSFDRLLDEGDSRVVGEGDPLELPLRHAADRCAVESNSGSAARPNGKWLTKMLLFNL